MQKMKMKRGQKMILRRLSDRGADDEYPLRSGEPQERDSALATLEVEDKEDDDDTGCIFTNIDILF
jgi:hypothetical protein